MHSPLRTLQEVADYLRITRWTMYSLIKEGKIECTRVGRGWRFTDEQVIKFLALHSNSIK